LKKLPNFQVGEFQKKRHFGLQAYKSLPSERGDHHTDCVKQGLGGLLEADVR
jgi:hypothetical protein